ncbi:RagB/SusD family nutrient uptake outer membrane protein [Alistipes sp.]|uniref:RagB/SusD family nutrient uptake outer membrane protein n=1 Tax=Alistipes sp. TaxID=1872444 RepID=UPI003AEF2849
MKITLHKITIYLMSLAVLLGTASCLEKYPGQSIPEGEAMQTYKDAEQHLIGIYSSLKNEALYSGDLTILPDLQCDLAYGVQGSNNDYGDFWLWNVRSTDAYLEAVYGSLYGVIGNCNFYLDRIDRVIAAETDDDRLDDLEEYTGQVYAIRALCYSELIKCYCKAYDPATAATDPGVVLRTKYFEKERMIRASLEDSYRFVLDDLKRAEERLSDEDEDNESTSDYITAAAAQALRARVALYMQDWDTAIEYASKLIDDKKNIFSLASVRETAPDGATWFDYMWAYDQSPEVIWRIGFTSTSAGGALGDQFLGFRRDFTYYYPNYVAAQWVLDLYDDNDVRRASYFADEDDGIVIGYENGLKWPLLVKYWGNRNLIAISPTTMMHRSMPKPFRLAEQYLIRAEAYCRRANPDYNAASKDLTALRQKRYASGGTLNVTEKNWLREISNERVRELYMEGFRLQDLKRWGKQYADLNNGYSFERKQQTLALEEGSKLKIRYDNPLFVWPIPQNELEAPGSEVTPNESN